jgi:K(+)-stimulated pyrophosphate-energized sodium pump
MTGIIAAEGGKIPVSFRSLETNALWIILGISLIALVFAYFLAKQVLAAPRGTPKMIEISDAIQEGSAAYLRRQFRTVGAFVVVLGILLFFILPAPLACIKDGLLIKLVNDNCVGGSILHPAWVIRLGRSLAFVLGAGFSAVTGFAGMSLAVRANVRTANAARESGLRRALTIAFRAGGVAGMFTVGLGLLGAVAILLLFKQDAPDVLIGFGFGGALLAMFMRVGGGIFTKAADVGADLVGKVEQDIPEDDPRNAATIADNVGDNVGDCAGMAADLFESYEVTLVAAIILGSAAFISKGPTAAIIGVTFPLFVRAIGVITSIIGIYLVSPRSETEHGMRAINRGFFASAALSAGAVAIVAHFYAHNIKSFYAVAIGLVLSAVIQVLTQHFTDTTRAPVQEVAKSSTTGPATTILSGFSVGMESTVWALLAVAGAIIGAFLLGHSIDEKLYYIALSGMGMLTTVGVIVSMDTYGPVSDNAQGIAEMSGEFEGRPAEILQGLDAVGNSTKAITKGMAIATAVIAATSLFGSFREIVIGELSKAGRVVTDFPIRVDRPNVLVGLLIGGAVAFLFASLAVRAVGRAAGQVVSVVREQFKIPGIMEGTVKPDYAQVVDICTRRSLRELLTPGLLAVLTPILVGFALKAEALGAYLAGVILTGQLLAVMLSNSGGAWDNAKKLVEEGHYGGKGSDAHKATVIGDTVGDPFKDTAGPALNPLIKVMNLVSLLTIPVIVKYQNNNGARAAIVAVGVIILGLAIANSKKKRPEDEMIAEPPAEPMFEPAEEKASTAPKSTTRTKTTTKTAARATKTAKR